MPRATTQDRVVCALYCHGPCSATTLAGLVGEEDAATIVRALGAMASRVATRTVTMAGWPVELYYLKGNGVG
jgi:hypothetical protein